VLDDLPTHRMRADLTSGCEGKRNAAQAWKLRPFSQLPGRAVSSPRARSSALPAVCHVRGPLDHFVGYLTVYNTVLLVLPFSRPTVTVIRFRPPSERDCPVTHYAISDDGNGAR